MSEASHCSVCGICLRDDDHRWGSAKWGLCRECGWVESDMAGMPIFVPSDAMRKAMGGFDPTARAPAALPAIDPEVEATVERIVARAREAKCDSED